VLHALPILSPLNECRLKPKT